MIKAQSQVLEEDLKNHTSSSAQLLWFISSLSLTEDGEGARMCVSCYDRDGEMSNEKTSQPSKLDPRYCNYCLACNGKYSWDAAVDAKNTWEIQRDFFLAFGVQFLSTGKLNRILAFHAFNVQLLLYIKSDRFRNWSVWLQQVRLVGPQHIWSMRPVDKMCWGPTSLTR